MSQKSSLPQPTQSVSRVLTADSGELLSINLPQELLGGYLEAWAK